MTNDSSNSRHHHDGGSPKRRHNQRLEEFESETPSFSKVLMSLPMETLGEESSTPSIGQLDDSSHSKVPATQCFPEKTERKLSHQSLNELLDLLSPCR